MSWLRRLTSRFAPARARAIEREADEEIRFHLEMRAARNQQAGMSPERARREAERTFGQVRRVREAARELLAGAPPARDGMAPFEALLQDGRFAVRMLRRYRLTAAVAVVSIGLGLGANAANFSIVYGVLYRTLPFTDPERVIYVDAFNDRRGVDQDDIAFGDLIDLRATDAFSELGAVVERTFTLTAGDRPERIEGASVTPGLLASLGMTPALGRDFRPDEAADFGFEPVVILGDALWRERFGADPDILGKTVHLNGRELVIVGVLPQGVRFPARQDLWTPLGLEDAGERTRRFIRAVGKLAPGVSVREAQARLDTVTTQLQGQYPDSHADWQLRVQPYQHGFVDERGRQLLSLLLASVGFVLLLACANVANLLLARAGDRAQELAVRGALGAGRFRLMRQLLVESLLLALGGGLLGLIIAQVWLRTLMGSVPEPLGYFQRVAIDGPVLAYMAALTVGTGLLFGLLPAMQGSRAALGAAASSGRRVSRAGARVRQVLVVAEVALAVVLVVSAGLMTRSFLALQEADPGFDDAPLLSLRLNLAGDQYDEPAARAEFFNQALQRINDLPGVVAAVATGAIPFDDSGPGVAMLPEAGAREEDAAVVGAAILSMPGLYETLGTSLLQGRDFTLQEATAAEPAVAIVGRSLAETLWPGQEAVGQRVRFVDSGRVLTVVGVAPDLQYEEFGEETRVSMLQVHVPYTVGNWRFMSFLVRSEGDPAAAVQPVRDALAAVDGTLAPYDILTMPERRSFTIWHQRVFGKAFGVFGAIALLLAVCGVYAVIAYSVSQRTHEMGVRMALGARPRDVRRQVVLTAMRTATLGLALGLAVAALFARALGGLLYGVGTGDPAVFAGVTLSVLAAAGLAAWIPAQRASRVDPTEALRVE